MKTARIVLLLCLLPLAAAAQGFLINPYRFASAGASPTFSWGFESDTVTGATIYDYYSTGATPLPDKHVPSGFSPIAGANVLRIQNTATFPQVRFFNDVASQFLAPIGGAATVEFYFRWAAWTNSAIQWQITGKTSNPANPLDTNDAWKMSMTGTTNRLRLTWDGNDGLATDQNLDVDVLQAAVDTWYKVTAKYNAAGSPYYLTLQITNPDGTKQPLWGYTTALTAAAAGEWHHLLIGNDTTNLITAYYDEFKVYDSYVGADFAAPTLIVNEGAEGTGTPAGWTDANSPQWDYTTTILEGSQSLGITGSTQSTYNSFSGVPGVWVRFRYRTSAISTNPTICSIRDSSGNQLVRAEVRSTGGVRFYNAANTSVITSAGSEIAINTDYYIWIYYLKGTGANAAYFLYKSTNSTRPGTPLLNWRTGDSTANAARLLISTGVASTNAVYDNILVSADELGNGTIP